MKTITINLTILLAFLVNMLGPLPTVEGQELPWMPKPGTMVHLSPEFTPAHLTGMTIHPDNALKFDFLIHRGDVLLTEDQKKQEYQKLVKYFLASLTIPDDDQWVNLSPYEKDRIIKDDFGKTEMGRDLLAQDYILKQLTSSLIYPEERLGKKFWDKIYERAWREYHTTNIPVNTFNKVWIIPDEAAVYESGNTVYVLRNHLKVMLEEDYLSLSKHNVGTGLQPVQERAGYKPAPTGTYDLASQIIREIVLPALETEVNEGKNFAPLRQIYSGMILATWYKKALKESLLGKIYADKAKVKGVNQDDTQANQEIYQQYLQAFKKGVFNYIKEDIDKYTRQEIPRKYFSGGFSRTRGMNESTLEVFGPKSMPSNVNFAQLAEDSLSSDQASIVLEIPSANSAMASKEAIKTYQENGFHVKGLKQDARDTIEKMVSNGVSYAEAQEWYQVRKDKGSLPRGFWDNEDTARQMILVVLDTIEGFKAAREADDIDQMKRLYEEHVLRYGENNPSIKKKGQVAFFKDVGRLEGLLNRKHDYFGGKSGSPHALLKLALPEFAAEFEHLELGSGYWSQEKNAKKGILKALFKIDGFKEAYEDSLIEKSELPEISESDLNRLMDKEIFEEISDTQIRLRTSLDLSEEPILKNILGEIRILQGRYHSSIEAMAGLYRAHVLTYQSQGNSKNQRGAQAYFQEQGGLETLMSSAHKFLEQRGSAIALIKFAIPGLVDNDNPVALHESELNRGGNQRREKTGTTDGNAAMTSKLNINASGDIYLEKATGFPVFYGAKEFLKIFGITSSRGAIAEVNREGNGRFVLSVKVEGSNQTLISFPLDDFGLPLGNGFVRDVNKPRTRIQMVDVALKRSVISQSILDLSRSFNRARASSLTVPDNALVKLLKTLPMDIYVLGAYKTFSWQNVKFGAVDKFLLEKQKQVGGKTFTFLGLKQKKGYIQLYGFVDQGDYFQLFPLEKILQDENGEIIALNEREDPQLSTLLTDQQTIRELPIDKNNQFHWARNHYDLSFILKAANVTVDSLHVMAIRHGKQQTIEVHILGESPIIIPLNEDGTPRDVNNPIAISTYSVAARTNLSRFSYGQRRYDTKEKIVAALEERKENFLSNTWKVLRRKNLQGGNMALARAIIRWDALHPGDRLSALVSQEFEPDKIDYLGLWQNQTRQINPLSEEERVKLWHTMKKGELNSRHILVESFIPFVTQLATDLTNNRDQRVAELISAANVLILEAIDQWSADQKLGLTAFVETYIKEHLKENTFSKWDTDTPIHFENSYGESGGREERAQFETSGGSHEDIVDVLNSPTDIGEALEKKYELRYTDRIILNQEKTQIANELREWLVSIGFKKKLNELGIKQVAMFFVGSMGVMGTAIRGHSDLNLMVITDGDKRQEQQLMDFLVASMGLKFDEADHRRLTLDEVSHPMAQSFHHILHHYELGDGQNKYVSIEMVTANEDEGIDNLSSARRAVRAGFHLSYSDPRLMEPMVNGIMVLETSSGVGQILVDILREKFMHAIRDLEGDNYSEDNLDFNSFMADYLVRFLEAQTNNLSLLENDVRANAAMTTMTSTKGGIDFNAVNLNLQIKRDGKGVPLPLAQQDMASLSQIEGFISNIIEIKPAVGLPIFAELEKHNA